MSAGSGADGGAFCLDLSSLPRSLSPSPLSGSSSFFPCEHGCLLQVMNASSFAHCLHLDTLKLPQAVARRGKRNLKIACGLGLFFFSFFQVVAPPRPHSRPLVTLPPLPYSLPPTFPPLVMYKEERWVIDDNSADPRYFHAHTPFPPTGLISLSLPLLRLSHE